MAWLLDFLISWPLGFYLSGSREPVYHSSFGSCQSLLPLVPLKTPCLKEKRMIKQPERAVFSLHSPRPSQHPGKKLLYTCSREGTLAQTALGVPCSYFPAGWGRDRRGISWWVAIYRSNGWFYQELPYFQLIIKYTFFLSQIGTTGTTSQQQGEGSAPLTCWCANMFPFQPWLQNLGRKEWRSAWAGGRRFSG